MILHKPKLSGLLLPALFFLALLIRSSAYSLPVMNPEERSCLQDESGNPYLTEMDSYFYLRKAQEMAENDSTEWFPDRNLDPLIGQRVRAHENKVVNPTGISVLAAFVWKNVLSRAGISLSQTAIWLGPAAGSLAVIPAFCYVRSRTALAGALVSGLLTGCAIPFVIHTHAGFFDTDLVLAVLPLTGILSLIRGLCASGFRPKVLYMVLSAASFAGMSLFWRAYYGYYLFALLSTGIALLLLWLLSPVLSAAIPRGRRKSVLQGALLFLLFSAVLIVLTNGKDLLRQLSGITDALQYASGSTDSMPYALQFTSEMLPIPFFPGGSLLQLFQADLRSVTGRLGGLLPCLLALLWFPQELYVNRWKNCPDRSREPQTGAGSCDLSPACGNEPAGAGAGCEIRDLSPARGNEDLLFFLMESLFLGLWAVIGILLCRRSVRFTETAVLPVCILGGLSAGRLYSLLQEKHRYRRSATGILCCLLAAAMILCASGARKACRRARPQVTDSKCNAMNWIRDNTPPETAIASWWDDGYFIEYQAQRRTLADGGTDSGAMDWFLARALLTDDPDLMAGILRMLNESGTEALEDLCSLGMEQAEAADLLLNILPLRRDSAIKVLREAGLPAYLAEKTHPEETNPVCLTLSTDLLAKHRALGYYAFWDPEKKQQTEPTVLLTSSSSVPLRDGRADIPMLDDAYRVSIQEDPQGEAVPLCSKGNEPFVPSRLQIWEDGTLIRDHCPETAADSGRPALVLLKEQDRYCALLCSTNLTDSMLVRLLVCEDRSIAQAVYAGTWYGTSKSGDSRAQQRISINAQPAWAAQVWEIRFPDQSVPGKTLSGE